MAGDKENIKVCSQLRLRNGLKKSVTQSVTTHKI